MLQHFFRRMGLMAVVAAGSCSVSTTFAADARPAETFGPARQAPVWQRVAADGTAAQAVILKANVLPQGVMPTRHAIVIDTSASQTGEHRRHAFEVVERFLAKLPAGHEVQLFAADLTLEALTTEFAAPQSETTLNGIQSLKRRVPLGASQLVANLETLLEQLPSADAAVVYVGDGQNTAELLQMPKVAALVQRYRTRQIPVTSYGVGPQVDLQMLGALAVQTGGRVMIDGRSEHQTYAAEQGDQLAAAVQSPVWYPQTVQLNSPELKLIPSTPLPVRADRETIYLAQGVVAADAELSLESPAGSLKWKLEAPTEHPGTAFLPAYTQRAAADGGLNNALAGLQLAVVADGDFQEMLQVMVNTGHQALDARNPERAAEIAENVRRLDADMPEARQLAAAADKVMVRLVSRQLGTGDDDAAPQNPDPLNTGGIENQPAANPDLIGNFEQQGRVRTQRMQLEVSRTIERARAVAEPDVGIDELKRQLTTVRAAIDINPEDRSRMLKQLEGELLAATTRQERLQQSRDRMQQRLAQEEAQRRLMDQMILDEERLENLIDRVRALMEEGRHGRDEAFAEAQAVAEVAVNMRPQEGTSTAARFNAVAAEQLVRSYRLRVLRSDMFLETLHQVELSHVPFPDEPPIVFPPAAVWQALSQRRIARYSSVDLKKNSAIERQILEELKKPTELSFTDTPLDDVIDFLKDYHRIPIWIDRDQLSEEGIDSSTETITIELSGVSLRSGLRRMLQGKALTYIIDDDLLVITTQEFADNDYKTRVYPVADLVVMIGMGGGGMGGMGGGMMGGMGGMGMGGMGGMGMGGMGGGMMGGMGGGFPSLPAEPVAPLDGPAADAAKKK